MYMPTSLRDAGRPRRHFAVARHELYPGRAVIASTTTGGGADAF